MAAALAAVDVAAELRGAAREHRVEGPALLRRERVRGEELVPVGGEDVLDLYSHDGAITESTGLATPLAMSATCR